MVKYKTFLYPDCGADPPPGVSVGGVLGSEVLVPGDRVDGFEVLEDGVGVEAWVGLLLPPVAKTVTATVTVAVGPGAVMQKTSLSSSG